jgi:hypothetical protein
VLQSGEPQKSSGTHEAREVILSPTAWAGVVCAFALALVPLPAPAAQPTTLEPIEVIAARTDMRGIAESASEGTATRALIEARPLGRPGDLLEMVPGLVVTQHSGSGKANQYFLRGFNLDHGTDFATWVAGMPVNLPTHGHGQGYTDLSFLVPELVAQVRYRKGPYFADEGDFSSAGVAHIDYLSALPSRLFDASAGQHGYRRGLLAGSRAGLLYALEWTGQDGPWDVPENARRINAVLRYSDGDDRNGWNLTAMAYSGRWTATDQIAQRALDRGEIGRYGSLDPTDGGSSRRMSLSGQWQSTGHDSQTRASVYAIDYRLNLFSNFTYVLNDGVNADQFEQTDRRVVSGGRLNHLWVGRLGDVEVEHGVGLSLRNDNIVEVGLHGTRARSRLATVRQDRVTQTAAALHYQNTTRWAPAVRTIAGLRADVQRYEVRADNALNSDSGTDRLLSPKFSLVLGPWRGAELYANAGRGFHSNDVRGATIQVDPATGDPADRVPVLVRTHGGELGMRAQPWRGVQSTLSAWRLDIGSELVFVGDAGTTEASFPSRRQGIEWVTTYTPRKGVSLDLDLALARARFTGNPTGDRVPGSVERSLSVGVALDSSQGWFGGARVRHFGPRPLVEDNSVRSSSSTLVNAYAGYRLRKDAQLRLEVINALNRKVSDIEYHYCSRLPSDAPGASCADGTPGVDDRHLHPAELRTLRVSLALRF